MRRATDTVRATVVPRVESAAMKAIVVREHERTHEGRRVQGDDESDGDAREREDVALAHHQRADVAVGRADQPGPAVIEAG